MRVVEGDAGDHATVCGFLRRSGRKCIGVMICWLLNRPGCVLWIHETSNFIAVEDGADVITALGKAGRS